VKDETRHKAWSKKINRWDGRAGKRSAMRGTDARCNGWLVVGGVEPPNIDQTILQILCRCLAAAARTFLSQAGFFLRDLSTQRDRSPPRRTGTNI